MSEINWYAEVEKRSEQLLEQTKQLLKIKSILNEDKPTPEAPLGKEVREALDFMLQIGAEDNFTVKNVDNLAGHIEFGKGEELIGVLCHVDVVPTGDGWISDPFEAEVRNGKLYARGAIDDKGPTMAAYYAMKIVKELDLPLKKRVRMIIGTDEESDWRCVERYFKTEEMPTIGFAPDADFPIINAEKGIADFEIATTYSVNDDNSNLTVQSFSAGQRKNMVPDFATCTLIIKNVPEIAQQFKLFTEQYNLRNKMIVDKGNLILQLHGVSAHGMEPNNGKNAGLYLAQFLNTLDIDANSKRFFEFVTAYFQNDSRGQKLNISYKDDITGELTLNVGVLEFDQSSGGKIGISMRYPVTTNYDETISNLCALLKTENLEIRNLTNSPPHHVDKNSSLIKTLQSVYEKHTNEKASLLSIGGGTYARSLENGVAFGPLFPGRDDVAHQKNEYIIVEDLLKATAIYANAIYELAK